MKGEHAMRMIIRDLIADVRCAERDNLPEYAEQCRQDIKRLFPLRHSGRRELNIYGWPNELDTQTPKIPGMDGINAAILTLATKKGKHDANG